jgi:hypothetical protein
MLPLSAIRQNALEHQIKKEQAAALGRAGQRVKDSLQALSDADQRNQARYTKLLYAASDAVWRYFVQREAVGINNHAVAIEEYAIPKQVLNLVGARPPSTATRKRANVVGTLGAPAPPAGRAAAELRMPARDPQPGV